MIITIHQPNYLPWLGFFYKLSLADVLVFLDNVQFTKNGYQNRTEIKTSQGKQWLTVPVLTKGKPQQLTNAVEIDNKIDWRKNHWKTIVQNYSKSPHFALIAPLLEEAYAKEWCRLVDLNEKLIQGVCKILGLELRFVKASELNVPGTGSALLLNICQVLKADTYISGPSGKDYLDVNAFNANNVKLDFSAFKCPPYPQMWGNFIPNLSVIDLIANGGGRSLEILRGKG